MHARAHTHTHTQVDEKKHEMLLLASDGMWCEDNAANFGFRSALEVIEHLRKQVTFAWCARVCARECPYVCKLTPTRQKTVVSFCFFSEYSICTHTHTSSDATTMTLRRRCRALLPRPSTETMVITAPPCSLPSAASSRSVSLSACVLCPVHPTSLMHSS